MDIEARTCGECIHCNQMNQGIYRYCNEREDLVYSEETNICEHFRSVCELDDDWRTEYESINDIGLMPYNML